LFILHPRRLGVLCGCRRGAFKLPRSKILMPENSEKIPKNQCQKNLMPKKFNDKRPP
jgi:hypothetical protein